MGLSNRWSASLLGLGLLAGLAGCGSEVQQGQQQVGQRCYTSTDCASTFVCSPQRICVPPAPQTPPLANNSANNGNNGNNTANNVNPNNVVANNESPNSTSQNNDLPNNDTPNNTSFNNENPNNTSLNNDTPNNTTFGCEPGERYCVSDASYEACVLLEGDYVLVERACRSGQLCEEGRCVDACVDRDGDGAFGNCEPLDCDDTDETSSPFAPELCDGVDNNCDGRTDEGCAQECCAGGCAGNTFCSDCACVPYNASVCTQDNQPCTNIDQFSNGYYCADIGGGNQPRCLGLCDLNSPMPASTCPSPDQSCVFGEQGGQFGICLDDCDVGDSCGSPDLGCLPYSDPTLPQEGVCLPGDANKKIGDPCDDQFDGFFSCEPGSLCVNLNPQFGTSTCTQACRPFLNNGQTDCDAGSNCLAFSQNIGVCTPSNSRVEGDSCSQLYSACSEDNVTCYPTRQNSLRCQRTCRTSQGNGDCTGNDLCRVFSMDNPDVGVCVRRNP